jgi:nitrogen fixation/metabolism regulation signal transduction histidine kinase
VFARQRIHVRLALAIVLTALIPVTAAIVLARSMVQQSSERFFVPEIRQRLEMALGAYRDLASVTKASMRVAGATLALDPGLRSASERKDERAIAARLEEMIADTPNLARLSVLGADERELAAADRGKPIDPEREHQLLVESELSAGSDGGALVLAAQFATSKERFDEFEQLAEFIDAYALLEDKRDTVETTYVLAFAALLGITIVLAVGAGTLLARGVATRLSELAAATREVARGDLSIRVSEQGRDEISELGRAFNRMLGEVDTSRSRIEYLSRLASWQEMARRLAHEIKNPLTPIQLAVQEAHDRLSKSSPDQRQLLDATLEIVQSEVGTLRRLVGEFSEFARLPQSHMERADLYQFLREIEARSGGRAAHFNFQGAEPSRVTFRIPDGEAPVEIDRQMLGRALFNLVKNALEACAGRADGRVRVWAEPARLGFALGVDDDGPGVPKELADSVFEPYTTTKDDGTGLGLAIVKKIGIDHGGSIEMAESDWGGARVRVVLPRPRDSRTNESRTSVA